MIPTTEVTRKKRVAALYARVSTEEQTVENQVAPLEEWAERNGFSDTKLYSETASGAKQSRTQLGMLMEDVRAGVIGAVVVVKLDRLGRSLQHLLQLVEEFRNKKIQFVSLGESIDTTTAQGMLFLQIAGAFAEYERELIRERTNAGLKRARKKGKKLGRPKGKKDGKVRRKSGYLLRWARQRQKEDRERGIQKPIEFYIDGR